MIKILVVEDDFNLSNGIEIVLKNENNFIYKAHTLNIARKNLEKESFDLIILDINLPDGNGLDFLKETKAKISIPIILLTAKNSEADVVVGLESGADDYITKPFSLSILKARVNTQLRKQVNNNIFIQKNFIFNFTKMEFWVGANQIELSKTEQKLLKLLIDNKGTTLKRSFILDRIWTDGSLFVDENALSVAVKRLRSKLLDDNCIKTVYGIGYTWEM